MISYQNSYQIVLSNYFFYGILILKEEKFLVSGQEWPANHYYKDKA